MNFIVLKEIPLFQAVDGSKADTILPNLTTYDQITPNKQLFFLLFSKKSSDVFLFPIYLWIAYDLWLHLEWLPDIIFEPETSDRE